MKPADVCLAVLVALIWGFGFVATRLALDELSPALMTTLRFSIAALQDAGVKAEAIYLSMERNMKCAVGFCGHCQYGPYFICKDGPVFPYSKVRSLLEKHEI